MGTKTKFITYVAVGSILLLLLLSIDKFFHLTAGQLRMIIYSVLLTVLCSMLIAIRANIIVKRIKYELQQKEKLINENKELNKRLEEKLQELEIKHFRLQEVTESLEDSNSIIMTIANAVEAKDMVTNGHVNRVAYWSQRIGERLALSSDELELLKKGSTLHDIGKIGIPDNILNKPGALTKEEFEIMKTHTIIGENIIKSLKSFDDIKSMIRHHHEKLDGSGYPDGLKETEIDLFTRIVAIVDIYDALTMDRPYRKAMSIEQAFSIMEEDAKKGMLDSSLVEILKEEVVNSTDKVCIMGSSSSIP